MSMASINYIRASDGTGNAALATVQSTRSGGATTIAVDTIAGFNSKFYGSMGTPHTFVDPVTSETITVISEDTAVDFKGHIDGSNIEIDAIAPGYTDNGSAVGDIVIVKPTTQWADNVADTLEVSHNDDGTLKIADSGAIYDENGNELVKTSTTASAVNEVTVKNAATGNAPVISATGGDTNIDLTLTPKGTGEVTKAGNPIDWWEEIGRTTLGSAGDTITVSSLPARKYLRIGIYMISSGSNVDTEIRFNGDTGNNYAYRVSSNGGADATSLSNNAIKLSNDVITSEMIWLEVINVATKTKLISASEIEANGAASVAPGRRALVAKWVNTSDQISAVNVVNSEAAGDFASGSEVVVLGHD